MQSTISQPESDPVHPDTIPVPHGAADAKHDAVRPNRLRHWLTVGLLLIALVTIVNASITSPQGIFFLTERFQTFVTIFLGIFIEAAPFLLAGSIVSGFIAIFVSHEMLARYLPKQPILAALAGASMGIIFPVCECGVVPVTRRLYEKGLPMSIGIAFLLAAPVVNPIVVISTYAAFGFSAVLVGRLVFSLLIAFVIGLIFQLATPRDVLLPTVDTAHGHHHHHGHMANQLSRTRRIQLALNTAGDDFLDMARYLIAGSLLAAGMQTIVPQGVLLAVGQGPVVSVFAMQALAFVLSICSTVDAFLALAFTGTFTVGSIIAFLTFGPMVDIKSSLMFLGVFQRRVVAYLILLPLLLSALIGIVWNLLPGL